MVPRVMQPGVPPERSQARKMQSVVCITQPLFFSSFCQETYQSCNDTTYDVVTSQLLKPAISRKVYIFRQRCSHEKCLVFRAVYDRPISFLEFRSHNFIDREWAPVKARGHHVTPEVASKKYQPGK